MEGSMIVGKDDEIVCSFCRKPVWEVARMVADPAGKVYICDDCIKVCAKVVSEEPKPEK